MCIYIYDRKKLHDLSKKILHDGQPLTLRQWCTTYVKSVYIKENDYKVSGSNDFKLIAKLTEKIQYPIIRGQNENLKNLVERIERIKNKTYYIAIGNDDKEFDINKTTFDFCQTLNK